LDIEIPPKLHFDGTSVAHSARRVKPVRFHFGRYQQKQTPRLWQIAQEMFSYRKALCSGIRNAGKPVDG
jgi:hypothetical protein